jgi:hypothetical protein
MQGCHKGRNWRKITVRTSFSSGSPFRPDVCARPRLPRGRVFTVRGSGKNRVRADAQVRPRGRSPTSARMRNFILFYFILFYFIFYFYFYFYFLVVVAGLERERIFSIFGFRFSIPKIPKIPKLPELRGLRGRSRAKKKVFSA